MRFFIPSIKYTFKNFHKLFLFMLIPAVLLGIGVNFGDIMEFFMDKANFSVGIWSVYCSFSFFAGYNFFLAMFAFGLTVMASCLIFSASERHMRLGKFSYSHPFRRLNDTILIVLPVSILAILAYELLAFLNAIIIVLFNLIVPAATLYIAIATTVIMTLIFVYIICQFMMWIPSMFIAGYKFRDACLYSVHLVTGNLFRIFISVLLAVIIIAGLGFLVSLIEIKVVSIILNSLLFLILLLFVTSLTMVSYFVLTDEPRKDEAKKKSYIS